MVGTVQSGIANVYQNTQNIAAGNGFQNQAAQAQQQQQQQRAEQTQESRETDRNNTDEANLSAQRAADNEVQANASSDEQQRPGSLVDISV